MPPEADEAALERLADEVVARVPDEAAAAMVQGEFTLAHALVRRLSARGVSCVAATTERVRVDLGEGRAEVRFRFVRFRRYAG